MFHVKQSLLRGRNALTQLKCSLPIRDRTNITRIVRDDSLTVTRRLRNTHGTRNNGLKGVIREVRADLALNLLRQLRALIRHREQHARNTQAGVDSPNYEKLKVFLQYAKANEELSAWKADHEEVEKGFEQAIERLKQYRDSHGFTGKAGKAMDNWVNSSIRRINGYRDQYTRGYEAYEAGRSAMAEAYAEGQSIKDELLDASTAAMRYNPVVFVPASVPSGGFSVGPVRVTTGSAYVDAVEAQANIQREEACARILSTVNDRTSEVSNVMENYDPLSAMDPKGVDEEVSKTDTTGGGGGGGGGWRPGGGGGGGRSGGGHGGGGGYSPENGFGREAGRNGEGYPGGFDKPWWSEADAAAARNRVIASGAVPRQELPYGELG